MVIFLLSAHLNCYILFYFPFSSHHSHQYETKICNVIVVAVILPLLRTKAAGFIRYITTDGKQAQHFIHTVDYTHRISNITSVVISSSSLCFFLYVSLLLLLVVFVILVVTQFLLNRCMFSVFANFNCIGGSVACIAYFFKCSKSILSLKEISRGKRVFKATKKNFFFWFRMRKI